jgi:hypothetical protein
MKRRGRKPAKGVRYLLGGNVARFRGRSPAQQFGQHGTRCDGGNATLGLETHTGDVSGFDPNGEAQHIAADRIRHFDRSGSIGKIARVAGFAEVVEDGIAEHRRQYKAERPTLTARIKCRGVQNVSFSPLHGLSLFL